MRALRAARFLRPEAGVPKKMRGLALSTRLRIAAALMLLALRPCLIANACDPDTSQSVAREQAVLRHLSPDRRVRPASASSRTLSAALLSALTIERPYIFAPAATSLPPRAMTGALSEVGDPRAPPP